MPSMRCSSLRGSDFFLHWQHAHAVGSKRSVFKNSSRQPDSVCVLLSLSCVTNLILLCGIFAAFILSCKYFQMEWRAVVSVVAIPSQCSGCDRCLIWQYLSAQTPCFSCLLTKPAPCCWELAYLLQPLSFLLVLFPLLPFPFNAITCYYLSNLSPSSPKDLFVAQISCQKEFPRILSHQDS